MSDEGHGWPSHVAEINGYVDQINGLHGLGACPFVSPHHGGSQARVLSVLSNPGRGAMGERGSGYLTIKNQDPTSQRQRNAFRKVGVGAMDITPWNACPWYIDAGSTTPDMREWGVDPLFRIMELMPRLEVVFLQGKDAQDTFARFSRHHRRYQRHRDFEVIETIHPAPGALRTKDPQQRQRRESDRDAAYQAVADELAARVTGE